MSPVRVLLADDHTLVRAGLRKLLETSPDYVVVGEAGDGLALLELAQQLQPGLVLMDIAMPGLNGIEATARLVKSFPNIKVLILSMHQSEEYVRQALRHGAAAYLLKDAAPLELDLALSAVMRGETYLSPAVSKGVVHDYVQRLRDEEQPAAALSPRQREVLQLVAEGHSTKEIARRLDLSVKTVDTHRSQLMKQLDIHEVAGLVRYALRVGLVSF
ncbi:MAG: response regulator transcription factor [Rhodoferax sp.]|jgi:DNA-binding NarL/FixJ family response regulator|uniref:response regulator n=1 Tax=Rhodoferax sp. TaxID=50421 RepID=UPI001B3F86F1|nr:response regulator transcription factor [Rhodoferax sp.]MBP9148265.1 response regulator transcription factor [Rhodoferax sp.]MBP9736089.1 response regulator transcription factor [Rhodoferax sp.]